MNKETRNKYSNFIFVHYSKGRKALWNHFHPTEIRRLSLHPTKVASQVALEDKEKPNFGVSKSCIVKSAHQGQYSLLTVFVRLSVYSSVY